MPIRKSVNHNFFEKWSPEMAYVLGFFTADGNMIKNKRGAYFISLEVTDKILLQDIRSVIGSNHKISARKRLGNRKTAYRLQIGSKKIFRDLLSLGVTPNKSKIIRLPCVPDIFLPHFIRGYFDGDGNVLAGYYKRRGYIKKKFLLLVRFTSGSKLFIDDLRGALNSNVGISGYIWGRDGVYVLNYSINESKKIFHFMYPKERGKMIYLERKKKIFDSFLTKC